MKYTLKEDEYFNRGYFCKNIRPNVKIHERLGRIKKKNDGRYEWTKFKCQFHKDWNIFDKNQGVENTEEEALNKLFDHYEK